MIILQIDNDQLTRLLETTFRRVLIENQKNASTPIIDRWYDLKELCEYLPEKPAKATLYAYVSANRIPYHKGAKKLRFLKSEIDDWLLQGKKKTSSECEAQTDHFLTAKKRRM